ncbi:MAG TPA: TVP38/TMEM64 family protein [Firmicutes bacterium]|nr:TVP38/TMEM64 family protein [Bacillota bacterium]
MNANKTLGTGEKEKGLKRKDDKAYLRRRRILGILSLVVVVLLVGVVTYFVCTDLLGKIRTPEEFRNYIESFGWTGRLVLLGLQCLQVVIALIPGEIIEVGAGYAFGPVEGTLLCMGGVAIASAIIFLLVKRLGIKLVEVFVSREKINELRFINSEKKLKRTIFVLFFIPGTPKDLFTYFAGLTRIKLSEFLVISLIARIPSVVSSTIGGHIINQENYLSAIILFAVTGAVSLIGMWAYNKIVKYHEGREPKEKKGKGIEQTNRK